MNLNEAKEILNTNGYTLFESSVPSILLPELIKKINRLGLTWEWKWHDFETEEFAITIYSPEKSDNRELGVSIELKTDWENGNIYFIAKPSTGFGNVEFWINKLFK